MVLTLRILILNMFLAISLQTSAGILGEFDSIAILPGHIDFNQKSPWYKNVVKEKDRKDGIETRTPSALIADLFSEGTLKKQKILKLIRSARKLRAHSYLGYCVRKLPPTAKSKKECLSKDMHPKIQKKWLGNKLNKSLSYSIFLLRKALLHGQGLTKKNINTPTAEPFLAAYFRAQEIIQAVRSEDKQRGMYTGTNYIVMQTLKNYLIDKVTIDKDRADAANLLIPKHMQSSFGGKKFFSLDDLTTLKERGVDLSKLDPIDSGLWRKPKVAINKFDLTDYNQTHHTHLKDSKFSSEEIEKLSKPEETLDFIYKPGKFYGGTTAKLYAKYKKDKWKIKYLVNKVGGFNSTNIGALVEMMFNASEINVESAANNLAAALGFTVDPTYYKHKIRLFFEDDVYFEDRFDEAHKKMLTEIEQSFEDPMYIHTALNNIKVDPETKRKYLEVIGVSLEKKSDPRTDQNLGFYVRHGLGKSLKREHRGLAIFSAWIDDVDIKNENNRIKLIPLSKNGKRSYRLGMSSSDMGGAFGHGMPNYFPTKLVRKVKTKDGVPDKIELNYRRLTDYKMLDTINMDDAKWMMSMIAQFSSEQLITCFEAAGFPKLVSIMYAQKLMGRRNQMLEALNMMGTVIKDHEGNDFVIRKEQEFTGKVAGYEEFFNEHAYLVDPENKLQDPKKEPFPRYWGAYWLPKGDSKPQKMVWKHLAMSFFNQGLAMVDQLNETGLHYTGVNGRFDPIEFGNSSLSSSCNNNRCFYQGIGAGVGLFIPFRFIMQNPDTTSNKPFLVVDLFRIGVNSGAGTTELEQILGFGLPIGEFASVGGKLFKIFEFIKVKATSNIAKYTEKYSDAFKTPKLSYKNIRKQFIGNMKPDETLILSRYEGLKAEINIRESFTLMPSPQMRVQGLTNRTTRIVMHKDKNNMLLVNWLKGNNQQIGAGFGVQVLFALDFINLVKQRYFQKEYSFAFDANKKDEMAVLYKNLNSFYPKKIPEKFSIKKRTSKLKQNQFFAGFFSYVSWQNHSRKSQVELYDYLNKTTSTELAYEQDYHHSKRKYLNSIWRSYRYRAAINNQNKLFLKVSFDMFNPQTKRKNFEKLYGKISPFVPRDFTIFQPDAVKNYIGDLAFNGFTVFSDQGLDTLFKNGKQKICESYVKENKIKKGMKYCRKQIYWDLRLWAFMKDYDQAQKHYLKLRNLQSEDADWLRKNSGKVFKQLREFLHIFTRYNKKRRIILAVKDILPRETYFQTGEMTSDLKAFPGHVSSIKVLPYQQGSFAPKARHIAENTTEVYKVFSDDIVQKVAPLMFDRVVTNQTR